MTDITSPEDLSRFVGLVQGDHRHSMSSRMLRGTLLFVFFGILLPAHLFYSMGGDAFSAPWSWFTLAIGILFMVLVALAVTDHIASVIVADPMNLWRISPFRRRSWSVPLSQLSRVRIRRTRHSLEVTLFLSGARAHSFEPPPDLRSEFERVFGA